MIHIEDLTKVYQADGVQVDALAGVDLSIEEGAFVALMGPSGSGKSTLLSVIGGMNPPTSGTISVDTIDPYELPTERQADFRHEYIGFLFQQYHLVPYLSALENVMLPLAIAKLPQREKRDRALEMLERVSLRDKKNRLPSQLSGGEQARVAIARSLVNNPPLLLADEPTGNLDSATGSQVLEILQKLHQEGQTVLMVTHDAEAAGYADRIIRLCDGRLQNGR
jgi:putative ABC transport system ATP-binding protein